MKENEDSVELVNISKESQKKEDDSIHELYVKVAKIERGTHEKKKLRSHIKEIIKNEKPQD